MSGMEAYGLVVSEACMKNGRRHHYGPQAGTLSESCPVNENS